jgi:DNA-binding Xre family transcriptional regulator
MTSFRAPLLQILQARGIRRVDLSAIAGVDLKVIHRLCRGDFDGMKIGTLTRVAGALGVAPSDLVPALLRRPSGGLVRQRRHRSA